MFSHTTKIFHNKRYCFFQSFEELTLLYLDFPTNLDFRNAGNCQKFQKIIESDILTYFSQYILFSLLPPPNRDAPVRAQQHMYSEGQLLTDAPLRGVTRGTIKARLVAYVTMVAVSNRETYKLRGGGKRLF